MNRIKSRVALAASALVALVPASRAQTIPAVVQSLRTVPAQPLAYEPFDVIVDFSRSYCLARNVPIVSQVTSATLTSRELSVVLSHLDVTDPSACSARTTSTIRMPGIAPGSVSLTLGLTQTFSPSVLVYRSRVVEQGQISITIAPLTAPMPVKVMTINGPYSMPFYLSIVDAQNLSGTGSLLPSAGAVSTPSFYAWASPAGQTIPSVAKLLYSLRFPAPVRYYYTTSTKERDELVRAGFVEQASPYSPIYVLPAVNGACPLGAAPVRRLFNAVDVLHRYKASVETASVLTANGYVDENIAFCSPPAPV